MPMHVQEVCNVGSLESALQAGLLAGATSATNESAGADNELVSTGMNPATSTDTNSAFEAARIPSSRVQLALELLAQVRLQNAT